MDMKHMTAKRIKRTLTALLLVFVLSFSAVFAEDDTQSGNSAADGIQSVTVTETPGATESDGSSPSETPAEQSEQETPAVQPGAETPAVQPEQETPAVQPEPETPAVQPVQKPVTPVVKPKPKPTGSIIKKGKYYYYKDPKGVIRKKAGFVTVSNKIYYVRNGGKIRTNTTFKLNKKYYHANRQGVIVTGIHKWAGGYYYYSDAKGVLKKSAGFVTWKGRKYYANKGGRIVINDGFTVKNIPYIADKAGRVTKVVLPKDNNAVINVARKQVGIMTGKTYWVWYYKTRFRDTDRTPWCGAFVAWVYNKANVYNLISVAKKYGPLGYVPSYSRYANKYKKWINKKNARAGDIIVFGRNRHVGLVEGIYGNYIVTIEGNAGPTAAIGCRKPGAVVRKIYKLNSSKIKGVIRVMKH